MTAAAGEPLIAVVVATHGRAALLPRLVRALEAQTLGVDRFEVVVVDDRSPDGTAALLAELATRSPLRLTVKRTARNGGPAVARNIGWRAATAELVAFTDDDCVPTEEWLAAGMRALDEGADLVSGRTLPAPDQSANLGPFARTVRVEELRFVQTANAFYRRRDLALAGGFDEALRTGEDMDLAVRVMATGARAAYCADALVHHDVRPSSLRARLRETPNWVDLPLVLKKHPELRRELATARVFWKPSHPRVLLAALGLGLMRRRRGALLLAVPWVAHRGVAWRTTTVPSALAALPGYLALDLLEVAVMARGSIKHRTLLL